MEQSKQLNTIKMMCVPPVEGPHQAAGAFSRLEKIVPLKGRKFYGVFDEQVGKYRACTEMQEDDNPDELGLEVIEVPGGLYAYETLEGKYQDLIKKIGPTFERMNNQYNRDMSRPSIEFYKRFSEFVLYLPIKE
jgi:hypothetical protein